MFSIDTSKNQLALRGEFRQENVPDALAALHSRITKLGYKDIDLNFLELNAAFTGSMLPFIAQCMNYQKDEVDFFLILPKLESLRRLFLNSNWANFLDFRQFSSSNFKGYTQVPAFRFTDGNEHYEMVNRVMDVILKALTNFDRPQLNALEWSINELTDNVINHAKSRIGGLIQVTNFSKRQIPSIEFTVSDAGAGIPTTLREGNPDIGSDVNALEKAIREGVTRDRNIGQGNGLFGSFSICQKSGGMFRIYSKNGLLTYDAKSGLHVRNEKVPFEGTTLTVQIKYGESIDLTDALKIQNKVYRPVDFIDLNYDTDIEGKIIFFLNRESQGFGSRAAAKPVHNKIMNLLRLSECERILVDFSDVPLVSSSYADELFGKLFVELGPTQFMQYIELRNVEELVKDIIDRAIVQRYTA